MRRFQTGRLRLLGGVLALSMYLTPVLAEASYTVKSGDTLSKLAAHFSITLNELITLNDIANPDRIVVGQILKLPDTAIEVAQAEEATAETTAVSAQEPPASRSTNPRELAEQRAQIIAEQGNKVVSEAKGFLGTPYRWAGSTSRGIDCSGLVMRSMTVLGRDVPHNAAALYQMGVPVSYSELQPGDLVFFNTNGRGISHVGIWMGDHQFIHASSSRGVTVQKMEGYYSNRLVGARRVH